MKSSTIVAGLLLAAFAGYLYFIKTLPAKVDKLKIEPDKVYHLKVGSFGCKYTYELNEITLNRNNRENTAFFDRIYGEKSDCFYIDSESNPAVTVIEVRPDHVKVRLHSWVKLKSQPAIEMADYFTHSVFLKAAN